MREEETVKAIARVISQHSFAGQRWGDSFTGCLDDDWGFVGATDVDFARHVAEHIASASKASQQAALLAWFDGPAQVGMRVCECGHDLAGDHDEQGCFAVDYPGVEDIGCDCLERVFTTTYSSVAGLLEKAYEPQPEDSR